MAGFQIDFFAVSETRLINQKPAFLLTAKSLQKIQVSELIGQSRLSNSKKSNRIPAIYFVSNESRIRPSDYQQVLKYRAPKCYHFPPPKSPLVPFYYTFWSPLVLFQWLEKMSLQNKTLKINKNSEIVGKKKYYSVFKHHNFNSFTKVRKSRWNIDKF